MSASRGQPPVNLKERIAALQQRSVSPPSQKSPPTSIPTSKSVSPGSSSSGGGLRDKIAKFEKKGGVPVPRGSFGLGAPPVAENGQSLKSRELYGNRIPGYVRAPSGPPLSRSGSPLPPGASSPGGRKRCISTSGLELAGAQIPFSPTTSDGFLSSESPLQTPTTSISQPHLASPRRNSIAASMGNGRRAASSSDVFGGYDSYEEAPSPSRSLSPMTSSPSVSSAGSSIARDIVPMPPSIVVSADPSVASLPSVDEASPMIGNDDFKEDTEAIMLVQESPASLESVGLPRSAFPEDELALSHSQSLVEAVARPSQPEIDEPRITFPSSIDNSTEAAEDIRNEAEDLPREEGEGDEAQSVPEPSNVPAPISEQGSIEEMKETSEECLVEDTEAASFATSSMAGSPVSVHTAHVTQPSLVASPPPSPRPSSDTERTPDLLETDIPSPPPTPHDAHVRVARRVSPPTDRAVPIIVPATGRTPPLLEPEDAETNFGSITISRPVDSQPQSSHMAYSEPNFSPSASASKPNTFSAVVHGKVVESSSHFSTLPAQKAPVTPQISRVRRTAQVGMMQAPQSPGYGELAVLLEEAALLEKRLMDGGLEEGDVLGTGQPLASSPTEDKQAIRDRDGVVFRAGDHVHFQSSSNTRSGGSGDGDEIPPTPPPKSPLPRYLSGIRRFASSASTLRSTNTMPGAYPRNSMSASSEMSSDDSVSVATPPDGTFDNVSHTDGRESGSGFGLGWPTISPKKSASSLSRASSFAERIWPRNRTKSGVSIVESDRSSANYANHARTSSATPLELPSSTTSSPSKPVSAQSASQRPLSWISQSSDTSSTISPSTGIFDKEIFDAFPSVPQDVPLAPRAPSPDRRIRYSSSHPSSRSSTSSSAHIHSHSHLSPPGHDEVKAAYHGRSVTKSRSRK